MKTLALALALALFASLTTTTTAFAQPGSPEQPVPTTVPLPAGTPASTVAPAGPRTVVIMEPPAQPPAGPAEASLEQDEDGGWKKPVGRRFLHGFRLGYTYLFNYAKATRVADDGTMTSLKEEFDLKTPSMMLLGYEGFYRIVGQSWLNVLIVGNVTVAGLEQSKFIPAASGLIGFEFDRSFQVGVGVNVTPDPEAPTHMIAAAGWTPKVGQIHTPVHFFFVPDTEGNHRMGATVGMTW